jgi:molecular chaperone DnaK
MGRVIGIDLGTTNSVVAVVDGPQPRVVENKEAGTQTPSAVSLKKRKGPKKGGEGKSNGAGEVLVGKTALDNFPMNPRDTIISVKRLMGRGVADPEVEKIRKGFLYEVVRPCKGTTDSIRVVMGGEEYSPESISAMILRKLKEDTEFRLGAEVTHAVITVPAYFNQAQKKATRDAGLQAGLQIIKILDEPTAAAVAFGIDAGGGKDAKTLLVYDLGGGTFDISVLMWAGNVFAPLNLEGDMWLGGDNFDQILVDHTLREVKKEHGIDPTSDLRFMAALRQAARSAKERLSSAHTAEIVVPGLLRDKDNDLIDVEVEVTRAEFERMVRPLVDRTVRLVTTALANANLSKDQINYVLMAGNSTIVPMVQKAMEDYFGAEKVLRNIHPKHCVAIGAAIVAFRHGPKTVCQAPRAESDGGECGHVNPMDAAECERCGASLRDFGAAVERVEGKASQDDLILGTPSPMSYGTQSFGDKFNVFIKKTDPYPTDNPLVQTFYTRTPNQRMIRIPVFAGDVLDKASANEKQGEAFAVLPPGLPQDEPIHIKLWLDADGVFDLTAHLDNGTDLEPRIMHGEDDQRAVEAIEGIERTVVEKGKDLSADQMNQIEKARNEALRKLQDRDFEGASALADEVMGIHPIPLGLEEKAQRLIGFTEVVLQRFGWALDPNDAYKLTNLDTTVRNALEKGEGEALEEQTNALEEATNHLPEVIMMLLGLRNAIEGKIRPSDPRQADEMSGELEAIENEFKAHRSGPALARLTGLVGKVQEFLSKAKPRGEGEKCEGCGAVLLSQRKCPQCGRDTWVLAKKQPEGASLEHQKAAIIPCVVGDLVHFSVTSPPIVTSGTVYLMDIWVHLEKQRQEVIKRALEEAGGAKIQIKSRGPVKVARGNVLTVRPRIQGFTVDPPQDVILWEGEIGNTTFTVTVPEDTKLESHAGVCEFYVSGLRVAALNFLIRVGAEATEPASLPSRETRARRAFASYASEDRDAVLARIQGLQKGVSDLDVFLDVASLRSGQRWQDMLRQEILGRDVLYLFWSRAASESKWVDWEWRCAYREKGLDFIDPVPLISPDEVRPPGELADLHFDDWVLAYMRGGVGPSHR